MNFRPYIFNSIKGALLICIIFRILTFPANAQQTGLSLSPSLSEILAKPDTITDLTFTIENLGDPALVSLKLLRFEPSDNYGNIRLKSSLKGPIEFNIKEYSLQEKKSFIMKSRESRKMTLSINIPEDTEDNDYYYSLIAQTDPPPGAEGSVSARASLSIASNILISVAREYPSPSDAKIVLFDIPSSYQIKILGKRISFIDSDKPFGAILTMQNKGIHRIKPEGSMTLTSKVRTMQSYVIPPQNILAQSQRTVQAAIPYRKGESSLYLSSISPGMYQLTALLSIPGGSTTVRSSLDFVAIPFNFINWFILITAILLIVVIFRRRKHNPDFESE